MPDTIGDAVFYDDVVERLFDLFIGRLYISEHTTADEIRETAENLLITKYEKGTSPGRGFTYTTAASVSVACDIHGNPYSIGDIVADAKSIDSQQFDQYVPQSDIDRRSIHREKNDIMRLNEIGTLPTDATRYLSRYIDQLEIEDTPIRKIATGAVEQLREMKPNTAPNVIAAAAIEYAIQETGAHSRKSGNIDAEIKQRDVADMSKITTVTIRRYVDALQAKAKDEAQVAV